MSRDIERSGFTDPDALPQGGGDRPAIIILRSDSPWTIVRKICLIVSREAHIDELDLYNRTTLERAVWARVILAKRLLELNIAPKGKITRWLNRAPDTLNRQVEHCERLENNRAFTRFARRINRAITKALAPLKAA